MFRLTTRISRSLFVRNQHVHLPRSNRVLTALSTRTFASSHDWQQGPSHPVLDKISKHPQIVKQLTEFTYFLQSKGVELTQKPNYMQLMKVMSDPEVKEKTRQLVQDMQAAGITLDMNSIREIQEQMAKANDPFGEEKPKEEKKEGVMDKVKGYFKKPSSE
ncbi:hypothetical protein BY458DRAFT_496971 [Sporodiniella umbellata]|nr:hypothetical protein BY458DRAFT_496971 [Sporodiniella umbellata]